MPQWMQNCKWHFDSNGKPLIYRGVNKKVSNPYYKVYVFVNLATGEETEIEQAD